MNKVPLLLLVGILSLSIEGCSYLSDFIGLRKEAEVNQNASNGISVNSTANSNEGETQVLEDEAAESSNNQQIIGLIPATDPNARVRSIASGRPDPFSAIDVQPQIEIEEEENSASTNVELPPRVTSTPTFEPPEDDFFEPPPEAEFLEPALAREVIVTGVVKVDGKNKIILNAPEESSSRYVEVGQYISNGQILVKGIDFNNFPTPLVILEQFGVEVTKEVGGSGDSEEA